ncbi:MAG: N-acetylmuramoyl-L-alanine amidase [Acidobacteriaceae bacterium]|nr:N-acetylmuramoyl-L-alanine amidase [Acidobacteriaceae bacterium]MBV9780263.1 N-acetylmuramoyl-L-alanine amidase [Acidobacteriaceae bacterium]
MILVCAAVLDAQTHASRVEAIRYWSFGDVTRIAIQTQGDYKITSDQIDNPARLYFDLTGLRPSPSRHRGLETIEVKDQRLKQIRVAEVSPGRTRIVFDLVGPVDVVSSQLVNPDRLIIELRPKDMVLRTASVARSAGGVRKLEISPSDSVGGNTTSDSATPPRAEASKPPLEGLVVAAPKTAEVAPPPQISVAPRTDSPVPGVSSVINSKTDHSRPPSPAAVTSPPQPAALPVSSSPSPRSPTLNQSAGIAYAAKRDSTGDRSLVRVFGLKLGKVVIDPGHGGHDTGTIGPHGLMEKDLVLDVALRLGRLINQQLGAAVVFTRSEDVFIPLEDRTKIANTEKADLFISIHANSSPETSATGVETYYFNLTTDQSGLELATRENATSVSSISDLNDLLHKAVLKTKAEESREFAQNVQSSLWGASVKMNNRSRDRGVRQAPFVVLIGATMPSILTEIGFVSNPHDEKLLNKGDQREKIAEALYKGVSQYANSLSHLQIARAATAQ